ncbi:response regulator transcription factor [Paradesulfitobacterium aromaticivorans]
MALNPELNVLLVEDDEAIAKVIKMELEHQGYRVRAAREGNSALSLALTQTWDIILLDIMLPHLSGYEICKQVRVEKDTPILLLTAKDEIQDKVFGLDLGADDYLTKPFAMEELLARMRAVMRRPHQGTPKDVLKFDALELDISAHQARFDGEGIQLTKTEFELLKFFLQHPRHVMSREQILEAIWGYDYFGDTNVVDVYMRFLRSKIDERFQTHYFQTVRGVGYVLRRDD